MGNLHIEPFHLPSVDTGWIQPFVTGGLGGAFNSFEDWSRTNVAGPWIMRIFSGASETNFAGSGDWSVGGGVSLDIAMIIGRSALVDVTYRDIDVGNVSGGTAMLMVAKHLLN